LELDPKLMQSPILCSLDKPYFNNHAAIHSLLQFNVLFKTFENKKSIVKPLLRRNML